MRRRFVQINGVLHEIGVLSGELKPRHGPDIMPDIKPYKSMIDGRTINSRSRHREHLRANGCVEIGDQAHQHLKHYDNLPDTLSQRRHEVLRSQVSRLTNAQFQTALKQHNDHVKWNSRKD